MCFEYSARAWQARDVIFEWHSCLCITCCFYNTYRGPIYAGFHYFCIRLKTGVIAPIQQMVQCISPYQSSLRRQMVQCNAPSSIATCSPDGAVHHYFCNYHLYARWHDGTPLFNCIYYALDVAAKHPSTKRNFQSKCLGKSPFIQSRITRYFTPDGAVYHPYAERNFQARQCGVSPQFQLHGITKQRDRSLVFTELSCGKQREEPLVVTMEDADRQASCDDIVYKVNCSESNYCFRNNCSTQDTYWLGYTT